MSFSFDVSDNFRRRLNKLARKDQVLASAVDNKIKQIIACDEISIQHFKNLKGDMSHLKRVRIGSFVLKFKVKGDAVIFEDFVHHKNAYK
ncbi:MAG: hypothetical protein ABIB71_03930 [Candidatus Woesearchaeota archaeon]